MKMLVLLIAVACAFISFPIIKYYLNIIRIKNYMKDVPGPRGRPIVGVVPEFKNTTDVIPIFMNYLSKYGGVVNINGGIERNILMVSDVKLLEFVMSSSKIIHKAFEYLFLRKWLGLGLLTSSGNKWLARRKLIVSTYHNKILVQFLDVFNKAGDILVEKLKKEVGKDSTDVYPFISLYTLDTICETAMGIEVNAQRNESSEYVRMVKVMGQIIVERSISLLKFYEPLYYFSLTYWKEREALKILHATTNSVIQKRKEILGKYKENVDEKKRLAFLDMLIKVSTEAAILSTKDIREEVDTFMFEGHDTTSSGISFALYLLSKHQQIQERVFKEIAFVMDNKNSIITHEDLKKLNYLEMVIQESLRLYPPVPLYSRILKKDVEYDGRILPKGLLINFFAYGVHRNPEIYPDPENFDPERFSPENKKNRNHFAYIPFSAGPRNCVGKKFAMMELKMTISTILKSYKLLPVVDFEPVLSLEIILKSQNGIQIRLEERSW